MIYTVVEHHRFSTKDTLRTLMRRIERLKRHLFFHDFLLCDVTERSLEEINVKYECDSCSQSSAHYIHSWPHKMQHPAGRMQIM